MLKFDQNKIPQIDFVNAKKKPIVIKCAQIQEEFQVETLEGIMKGKKGDWLMIGVTGEKYVCDNAIFNKTYEILK